MCASKEYPTAKDRVAELQQWLRDHPDADIEAVREVRRKLRELENEHLLINHKQ